ncbi:S1C family serine protease [Oerskovia flava]|uniref:S1C family serine protease n=1 Tax=Oerskovia flava TaxID=2986422 RepID=UPI0022405925|nr:trypsin-like peptidase domain-containing protein [Oerskovia sp. JB1-3-2]
MTTENTPNTPSNPEQARPVHPAPYTRPTDFHATQPLPLPPVPAPAPDQGRPSAPAQVHSGPTAGPAAGAAFGYPPAPPVSSGVPAGTAERPARRGWVPIVGVAAGAALLASLGTAGLTGAFDQGAVEPTSLATVEQDDEAQTVPVASSTSENPDWQAVTQAVAPSVVAIQVQTSAGGGEGSGVVLDTEGHVLTNNHVVEGAVDDTVQVTLSDGRLFEATIVGLDPTTDLAVVQLVDAPDDLTPATIGDSDAVSVGESVLAVGNPLGLANTATTGIVSALDRPVSASGATGGDVVVTNAIQIDAAINPGNSGGPLFNAQGEVIGITSSIATMSNGSNQSGSIGLGFAIPVNLASNIGEQLIADGEAEHAFLGVSLSDATATSDGVTRRGAQVEEVTPGSAADEAGIVSGDVIVAIDGDAVSGAESLTAYVRERTAGAETTLTVVRAGQSQEVRATLAARAVEETGGQNGSGQDGSGQEGQGDPTRPDNIPGLDELFPPQG